MFFEVLQMSDLSEVSVSCLLRDAFCELTISDLPMNPEVPLIAGELPLVDFGLCTIKIQISVSKQATISRRLFPSG